VLAPWQQAEVDRIAGNLQLLADNTQDAILFLGKHQHELWLPPYARYTSNMFTEATALERSASTAVAYANASKDYRHLRHELGMSS